jgi:uncharacterized protein YfbU (UPF0304 family)
MEFTNEQKLIVTLLTEIHAALNIKDGVDPMFVQEMVATGRTWALEWQYPGIFQTSTETPPEVGFVLDALDMWDVLERTHEGLSPADQAEFLRLSPKSDHGVSFFGFDGNHGEEYSIAHILINKMEKWSRFAGRDLNSHMPTVDIYSRMLEVYRPLHDQNPYQATLSPQGLAAVMNARIHPDNR